MKTNKNEVVTRVGRTAVAELHVRESVDGETPSRTIAGYAILFGVPSAPLWTDEESEAREIISAEAVSQELLDGSDIKFTMFHDRQLILARSKEGKGTLKYSIDERGVAFEFDAPNTTDGDKAIELVRRGDIAGCSFAFTTRYWDQDFVERNVVAEGGKTKITYVVKVITGIHDFTLAADPAYPDTSVENRELLERGGQEPDTQYVAQVRDMRDASARAIF